MLEAMEDAVEITRSDAQGILESHPVAVDQAWIEQAAPSVAATLILEASIPKNQESAPNDQSIPVDELQAKRPLKVRLSAHGNIDRGQDPDRPLPGVPFRVKRVSSIVEAATACRDFIRDHELGGGNWTGGAVTDTKGALVATISYNGRAWQPSDHARAREKAQEAADARMGPAL